MFGLTISNQMIQDPRVRDQVPINPKTLFIYSFNCSMVYWKNKNLHKHYKVHFTTFLMLQKMMMKFVLLSHRKISSWCDNGK